ncbi:MAG: CHAP domain-containing protein [Oscillospiraceae bacterium]|nr:CHAP domain-containing protein [Oscillospiraceae bacterium]
MKLIENIRKKHIVILILVLLLTLPLPLTALWEYCREPSFEEMAIRKKVVETAEGWLGCNEADGSHQAIIDLYNTQEVLPRSYTVTYEDSWCATFGSAVAMKCGLTDIIPTECSCEQQIALFRELGRWQERDTYLPQTGDYIFYDWEGSLFRSNNGWSDHVGIVVDTFGPFLKVIEGNKDDSVAYRYVFILHPGIRGYGLPDYESKA